MFIGGLIGTLPTEQHGVSGKFYIVDSNNIFIEDFNYDGQGPGIAIITILYNNWGHNIFCTS